jgi:hypothetical protein
LDTHQSPLALDTPPLPVALGTPPSPAPFGAPQPKVSGSLAVDSSAATEPEELPAAFAGPLIELVVGEERKPRIPRPFGIFLAVVLLASGIGGYVVFGPGGSSAEAAVYTRVYKVGESHAYTMTLGMRGGMEFGPMKQPVDVSMNMDIGERVVSVAPDGTSTVRFELALASVEANGQRMPMPGKFAITARVARDGRILSTEGMEGLAAGGANPTNGFFGPDSMQPTFPSRRIAPGDTWTTRSSQKIPFGNKPITVTTKNKLLRLETEHGIPVAVLHSVMEMPMNFNFTGKDLQGMSTLQGGGGLPPDAGMSFKGTMTFDAIQTVVRETGRPIAVTGEGVFDVVMKVVGAGAPPDASIKMRMNIQASFAEILGGESA